MNLQIQDACVELGSARVLDRVNLAVAAHYCILLGPSGCGKTTLLRAIAGLQPLHSGKIQFDAELATDGQSVRIEPGRRGVGMVFQDLALWPHLSAEAHLEFVLKSVMPDRAARRARIDELFHLTKFPGRRSARPSELSGGEAQRLAIARALAVSPRMLLLDEPLGSVDESLRFELAKELRRIQRATGLPVLHVTHDQREGLALADSVAVMHNGRIVQTGGPAEIYHSPATPFVASFIGKYNIIPAVVENGMLHCAGMSRPCAGVRPGNVKIGISPSGIAFGSGAGIEARVESRQFDADGFEYSLAAGEFTLRMVSGEKREEGESVILQLTRDPRVFGAEETEPAARATERPRDSIIKS